MQSVTGLLDRWLDPVGRALNPEAARKLLDLRADEATQQRVEELADRNTEGQLTDEERSEYEALVAASKWLPSCKPRHACGSQAIPLLPEIALT